MLPPDLAGADKASRRLLKQFRRLSADDKRSVLDFVEFLASRARDRAGGDNGGPGRPLPEPVPEPRPDQESVVAAIKRLSRVYGMLDRERMLGETSSLMASHLLQGRPAAEVIDDLEALFLRHYRHISGETDDV